jgi:hypothetical protein
MKDRSISGFPFVDRFNSNIFEGFMAKKDELKIKPNMGKKINRIMQVNLSFFE